MFFASYFDAPYEGNDLNNFFNKIAKSNFATLRSDLNEFQRRVMDIRTKKAVTIQSEVMRSHQEVEIANFLYLNTIEYEYEPIYRYDIMYARKPYTPDFEIRQGEKVAYIEHFGITQDGKNDRYSDDQLETYKKAIQDKIRLHQQHGTTLIYTFSQYSDRRSLTEHLQEELENHGFVLTPRSNKEVMEKLLILFADSSETLRLTDILRMNLTVCIIPHKMLEHASFWIFAKIVFSSMSAI